MTPAQSEPTSHYFTARDWLSSSELDHAAKFVEVTARPNLAAAPLTMRFATGLGTFSRGEFDAGSRLLLETVTWHPEAAICDLGCGWGALLCFAAKQSPGARVYGCDLSASAVQLSRLNVRQNTLSNARVWQGDGLSAAHDSVFDTVLCNPPVRAGNVVIARLFEDAHRCLKSGGALWIVLRTAQGAKSWQKRLADRFGNCETVTKDGGFRVLKSMRA